MYSYIEGGFHYEGSRIGTVYGPVRFLTVDISMGNNAGGREVLLPEGFQDHLIFRLQRDGEIIPVEELELTWEEKVRKYVYTGEPEFDRQDFTRLEPYVGIRSTVQIERKDGEPFAYGEYEIEVSYNTALLRFEDQSQWQGRFISQRHRKRFSEIRTIEDEKRYYVQEASEALSRKEPERALEFLQRVQLMEPTRKGVDGRLGEAYLQLGEYKRAVYYYEKALPDALGPGVHSLLPDYLALAYAGAGQEEKGIELMSRLKGVDEKGKAELLIGWRVTLKRMEQERKEREVKRKK